MNRVRRGLCLGGLLLAATPHGFARSPEPLREPEPFSFPSGNAPDAAAFKAALMRAGLRRGWTLQNETDGTYGMSINVRGKHTVEIDVKYKAEGYTIAYRSSTNMNFLERDGNRVIHPKYNEWVATLNRELQAELVDATTRR